MPTRFDGTTERLYRTASIPDYNAVCTLMGWFYLTTLNASAWSGVLALNRTGSSSDYSAIEVKNPGGALTSVNDVAGAYTEASGGTISVNTWYHLAIVRSSVTQLLSYIDGVLSITHNHGTVASRTAGQQLEIANFSAFPDPFNGRVAYVKVWTTNLSAAEILNEMRTIRPQRLADLWAWYPILAGVTERARDYSGNGRALTEAGTLTDEDPPPVSWGAPILWIPVAGAAAAPTSLVARPSVASMLPLLVR